MSYDNNVSDVDLGPDDSQSQFGGLGPKPEAGLADTPRGSSTGNVLEKPIGPGGSSSQTGGFQDKSGNGASNTGSQPIIKTSNTRFDAWMVDAQDALDSAILCAREPFTDKKNHAEWLAMVTGQVESLESKSFGFPPDLEARCDQKTREIRNFMDSVKQWPLTAQPTGEHVEKRDSIEVQGTSKSPQNARIEAGPGDDRPQRGNQAAGTRIEKNSNNGPTGPDLREQRPDLPLEANHARRNPEQRESRTAHGSLMPSCCCC